MNAVTISKLTVEWFSEGEILINRPVELKAFGIFYAENQA